MLDGSAKIFCKAAGSNDVAANLILVHYGVSLFVRNLVEHPLDSGMPTSLAARANQTASQTTPSPSSAA